MESARPCSTASAAPAQEGRAQPPQATGREEPLPSPHPSQLADSQDPRLGVLEAKRWQGTYVLARWVVKTCTNWEVAFPGHPRLRPEASGRGGRPGAMRRAWCAAFTEGQLGAWPGPSCGAAMAGLLLQSAERKEKRPSLRRARGSPTPSHPRDAQDEARAGPPGATIWHFL